MVLFNAFNLYNLIFFFQVGKIIYIYFHESSREISAEIINFWPRTMKYQVTNIETTNVALSMLLSTL